MARAKVTLKKPAKKPVSPAKKPAKRKPRPTAPADIVAAVLEQAGWEFDREDEDGWTTFRTAIESGGGVVETYTRVSEEIERFALYFVWGPEAAPEQRPQLAELVTRINADLGDGNFEMSYETGQLRLKMGVDFTGLALPSRLVRNAILDAIEVTERYEAALLQVLRGEASPTAALATIED